jgi:predicted nucleic acid-binding protein
MIARYLLDTNLLVYPHDPAEPVKAARALAVLSRVNLARSAALPAQALSELASVALRKLKPRIEPSAVEAQVEHLRRMVPVLPLLPKTIVEAVRVVRAHGFSYYDAQIWAVAKLGRIDAILSEDFNVGAVVEGVTFINPFDPTFAVDSLE